MHVSLTNSLLKPRNIIYFSKNCIAVGALERFIE